MSKKKTRETDLVFDFSEVNANIYGEGDLVETLEHPEEDDPLDWQKYERYIPF